MMWVVLSRYLTLFLYLFLVNDLRTIRTGIREGSLSLFLLKVLFFRVSLFSEFSQEQLLFSVLFETIRLAPTSVLRLKNITSPGIIHQSLNRSVCTTHIIEFAMTR